MPYRSTNVGGNYYRPSFFGGFSFFPPVIKWLLISNTAMWLLTDVLVARSFISGFVLKYLALNPWDSGYLFPWQLFSYMFLHGGFVHLLFNMLALWMFGMELENVWGSKQFLMYYLVCGVGAGIAHLIFAPLLSQAAPTVGASGGVYGVLVAFGMLFPDRPIYLYFLLPVKAKLLVAAYIIAALYAGVSDASSGIAHFAHLGGAAVGFTYVMAMKRGFSFETLWNKFKGEPSYMFQQRRARKPVPEEIFDAKFFDIKSGRQIEVEDELNQEVVDTILDKINTSGYQSLTDEEKRILNEASKKIN